MSDIYRDSLAVLCHNSRMPTEPTIERDLELEAVIGDLVERKYAAPEGSAERQLYERQLVGLARTRRLAGPIIEDLDPLEWGSLTYRLQIQASEGPPLPLRRRSGSPT